MKTISRFFIFIFFCFVVNNVYATHNRAGQITYEWIGQNQTELKYRVTITTFTKTTSVSADRPKLDSVYFDFNVPPEVFDRTSKIDLPNNISKNIYVKEHTYPGPGRFVIHFTDPNRNESVVNIPRSVSVPFYIESVLIINPFLGNNNSPLTTYDPIDQGCVDRIFIHNPGAFDPDPNDSLSYELVECSGDNGEPIPGYTYPSASNSFTLNPVTGDLIWDKPLPHSPPIASCNCNEYNVAFNILQWRNGIFIGSIRRDMQIVINNCDDYPPVIEVISDTCVLAGDTLRFNVTATDIDGDIIVLSESGGPFDSVLVPDPAIFTPVITNNDTVVSEFLWATKCHHVRPQPYFVQFRAASGSSPTLVDLKGTFIHVIAPPPPAVFAVPNGNTIDVNWLPAPCGNIVHYNIYRRNGMYADTIQCPCENGVPTYTGYTLIGTSSDGLDLTFSDNNNGQGLTIGIEYCYLITAIYADSSESCASPQICASLKKDAPVITNVDIRFTDSNNGSVFIGWSKPTELDTIQFPGPYQYRIFRSPGFFGNNFSSNAIGVLNTINDTSFIDTLIDTKSAPWSYRIDLYYTNNGTFVYKGQTGIASSVFLNISPTDNRLNLSWEEHVPWTNSGYVVFKQNASLQFDSIAFVNSPFYSDSGLVNGVLYCYYIKSIGSYQFSGFVDPIINRSQENCSIPLDNVPPCSPDLIVNSYCSDNQNELIWTNPNNSCADDVLRYNIYFAPSKDGSFELIDFILSPMDTVYFHTGLSRLSGCYKVTAIDSVGNETTNPVIVCVDTCRQYVLPSAFSPNGDGKNDLFHPCDSTTSKDFQEKNCPPYKNVKSVEMKIISRWGNIVFETKDKNINWDGKNKDTKADCSDGVYYYTCKVFFFSVKNEQTLELHGTIQLIRN